MITKEVIIELFKKQIDENIKHNGIITVNVQNNFIALFGFLFEFKSVRCHIGISGDGNAPNLRIYFNSIAEEISYEEFSCLFDIWKTSVKNKDLCLLENLASEQNVDARRRVLTEKRTGNEIIKF